MSAADLSPTSFLLLLMAKRERGGKPKGGIGASQPVPGKGSENKASFWQLALHTVGENLLAPLEATFLSFLKVH